jgi:hypothetical protein
MAGVPAIVFGDGRSPLEGGHRISIKGRSLGYDLDR